MKNLYIATALFAFHANVQAESLIATFTCQFLGIGPLSAFNSPQKYELNLSDDPQDTTRCEVIQPHFLLTEQLNLCISKEGASAHILKKELDGILISFSRHPSNAYYMKEGYSLPRSIDGKSHDSAFVWVNQQPFPLDTIDKDGKLQRSDYKDGFSLKVDYTLNFKNMWGRGKSPQRFKAECKVELAKNP